MFRGRSSFGVALFASLLAVGVGAEASVVIDTVSVGNAGNASSAYGHGGVGHVYDIGTFEVTAGQYTEFLNAVAADDTHSLYHMSMGSSETGCKIQQLGASGAYTYSVAPDRADRPVNFVTWGDAARFANWLHNGQPAGAQGLSTTEDGSYYLNGAEDPNGLMAISREADATWVIPSENEWFKAAYHANDGVTDHYFTYPTSSDSAPSYIGDGESIPIVDPGNYATYNGDDGIDGLGPPYYLTKVGEHENSASPYGTFDQGGNVWEWNEAALYGSYRTLRGGSFYGSDLNLNAGARIFYYPTFEFDDVGFRVAQVPEPATMLLLALGSVVALRGFSAVRRDKPRS